LLEMKVRARCGGLYPHERRVAAVRVLTNGEWPWLVSLRTASGRGSCPHERRVAAVRVLTNRNCDTRQGAGDDGDGNSLRSASRLHEPDRPADPCIVHIIADAHHFSTAQADEVRSKCRRVIAVRPQVHQAYLAFDAAVRRFDHRGIFNLALKYPVFRVRYAADIFGRDVDDHTLAGK